MSKTSEVLFNGECPVCSFEMDHYKARCEKHDTGIGFEDLNSADLTKWGIDADTAARRLHVLKDGELYAGMKAFVVLWDDLPGYRWLSRLVATPGIYHFCSAGYEWILAPIIYRWHLRRRAKIDVGSN